MSDRSIATAAPASPTGKFVPIAAMLAVALGFPLAAAALRYTTAVQLAALLIVLIAVGAFGRSRAIVVAGCSRLVARAQPLWVPCLLGGLCIPLVLAGDGYWLFVLSMAMIFAIMAIGLNIQLGEIGVVNLGFAGLFAIGAYTATLMSVAGSPFWLSTLAATAACWFAGALLGLCSRRTSGDYFALVTLGFGLIVHQLIVNLAGITRGSDGITSIPAISIFGHSSKQPIHLGALTLPPEANGYLLGVLILALAILVAERFRTTWVGRMWGAIRQDSLGVACFGLDVPSYRVLTIAFGSAFAGPAGSLFAHLIGFISPDDFTLLQSIEVLAMVILGGMGNVTGVVIGSAILAIAPEKLRFLGDYRLMIYGVMLVTLLIYRPKGLLPDPRRIFDRN
jgi:branched-chain amino acid transport system permease protein